MRRYVAAVAACITMAMAGGRAPAFGAAPDDAGWPRQWNMRLIEAEAAWDKGLMGGGVEIAVLDTGVHLSHQDMRDRIAPGTNIVEPGEPPQDRSVDDNGRPLGHGTHVAAIAAAGYGNGGVVGVAPKAIIVPVKVLSDEGNGSAEGVAAGIRWAADTGAEVINLSLGNTSQSLFGPATQQAIRYAWSKGSICVFAAGNDFALPSGFGDEPAIVVASVSDDDTKSYYSNGVGDAQWGLSAPGGPAGLFASIEEEVFSAAWESDERTDTYRYMQGTSQAAPHVAGAAALLRAAGLSKEATVARLLETAKDLGPAGPDSTYGAGRLDIAKAVANVATGAPPPTTASPTTTTTASQAATTAPPVAAPRPPAPPGTAPAEQEETPTTEPPSPPPSEPPPTTGLAGEDATSNTVVIEDGGSASGRPWVLIAIAAATLAVVTSGGIAGRRLLARRDRPGAVKQ